jgi:hypothetical protein
MIWEGFELLSIIFLEILEFWRIYLLKINLLHDEFLYDESLNSYHSHIHVYRLGSLTFIFTICEALSMVRLCRSLGTGHPVKIEIHLYTLPIYAASTLKVRIHLHPYTSTHIFCFYPGSTNPHTFYLDLPRK